MNRKIEDKLIELAFGDISPEEAQRLETQAAGDPSAAQALQEYRDMRQGLRSMAEVPEHQLSNERLRDAILARGLSQKEAAPAASSSRGWVWMPLTACAMAFTLVMWRNTAPGTTAEPQIVMDSKAQEAVVLNREPIQNPTDTMSVESVAPKTQSEPKVVIKEVPVEKIVYVPVENKKPVRVASRDTQRSTTRKAQSDREPIIIRAEPVEASDALPIVPEEQPIVLIAQERDADTGAQVATEVESESNVLVGG